MYLPNPSVVVRPAVVIRSPHCTPPVGTVNKGVAHVDKEGQRALSFIAVGKEVGLFFDVSYDHQCIEGRDTEVAGVQFCPTVVGNRGRTQRR